ncbi:MAG: DMT family transporter [Elusimicrobia bacterium]|nr:DMT family transporter [Elusimicrobiota bacterium]
MTAPGLLHETLGSSAALLSAAAWALSSILFRRLGEQASPSGMNLGKCILGSVALGAIILVIGMKPVPTGDFVFLGLSGLLGIALGDTLFFTALMNLGPRLALLLGALGPVFTVIMAVIFLGERPSLPAWAGIVATIAGVNWVMWESVPKEAEGRSHKLAGIKFGVLSIFCNAAGIILAKVGVSSVSALDGTFIRFLWGMAGLLVAGGFSGKLKSWLAPFSDRKTIKLLLSAVFVAIFGGFWLFLVALKHIDASIAVVLNETAPLFVLPLAFFMLKEKISPRSVIGAAVAVAGVALLFIR